MEVSHTIILGEHYYWAKINDELVGKCILVDKKDNIGHLKYIIIYPNHRGKDLSTTFWEMVECQLSYKKITLSADEFSEKHGKLVKLYQSWGFTRVGKDRYVDKFGYSVRIVNMEKLII